MAIREKFTEELTVDLTEEERNLRGRQAARIEVALEAHRAKTKVAKKALADDEKKLEERLSEAAKAAETGQEKRQVECYDELVGAVVQTRRRDTREIVGSRAATKQEQAEADEDNPARVPH